MQNKIENKEDIVFPVYREYGFSVFEMLSLYEWIEAVENPVLPKKFGIRSGSGDMGLNILLYGEPISAERYWRAVQNNSGVVSQYEMISLTEKSTEIEKREHVLADSLDKEYHVDDIKGVL